MFRLKRFQGERGDLNNSDRYIERIDFPNNTVELIQPTESDLIFDMTPTVYQGAAAVLYPATFAERGRSTGPISLIRNVKSRCSKGVLPSKTEVGREQVNKKWYLESRQELDCKAESTGEFSGFDRESLLPDNIFLSYEGARPTATGAPGATVTQAARNRRGEVYIPMTEWDPLAEASEMLYMPGFGAESYREIELATDYNAMEPHVFPHRTERIADLAAVASNIGSAAAPLVTRKAVAQFLRPPRVGDYVQVNFTQGTTGDTNSGTGVIQTVTETAGGFYSIVLTGAGIATTDATEACTELSMTWGAFAGEDVTPVADVIGSAGAPLVVADLFPNGASDLHRCPFYVGMPISVCASHNNARIGENLNSVISGLAVNGADLRIILATPIAAPTADGDATEITITARDCDMTQANPTRFTVSWTINTVYLQLAMPRMSPKQRQLMEDSLKAGIEYNIVETYYQSYTLASGRQSVNLPFDIPANCLGAMLVTPQNNYAVSGFDNVERYRILSNGKPLTNTDVYVDNTGINIPSADKGLHNMMLKRLFARLGQILRKYDEFYNGLDRQRTHAIYPLVLPVLGAPQQVTIELRNDNGANTSAKNMYLYSYHRRSLMLGAQGMSLM